MRRLADARGQAAVLSVVVLTALLGMAALVLDAGSWFHARRDAQSAADAAALAGAQSLPSNPAGATTLALQYAAANGGGLAAADVSFTNALRTNDTISVRVRRSAPGFFSKLFGVSSVQLAATAVARAEGISSAKWVAPIVVNRAHALLSGTGCPCFGVDTTLPLGKTGAPGAFDLVNLAGGKGGTGPATLASWIQSGYDGYLPTGYYYSDPGAKWNSSQVQSALAARFGSDLLFPVYDTLTGGGANAQYHVIGWVGFHLTAADARGSSGSLSGYFTQVIWEGIQSTVATPDFGARSVQLIN